MKYLKTFEKYEDTNETSDGVWHTGKDKIWGMILESEDNGWYGDHLQESTECVRLDRNNWLEVLINEFGVNTGIGYSGDPEVGKILKKIDENTFSLWEGNLEETFECVLTEDLYEDGESKYEKGEILVEYNGWYEDLEKILK